LNETVIDPWPQAAEFQAPRWKAVRLGLRLANSYLGPGLIGWFYVLWALIGVILCFVLIPMAIMGKAEAFNNRLNPIALYGFVMPMALMAAATWILKCVSRLLWCAVPEPLMAAFLAVASAGGRLAIVLGAAYLWLRGGPWAKGLLLPEVVACAAIAWLGLVADRLFIQALHQQFISSMNPAQSPGEMRNIEVDSMEDENVTAQPKQSIFKCDIGEWFKHRFPKGYNLVVWVIFPLGYVAVSSMADNGDPRAIPAAILRLAIVAPVILQIFWIPGNRIDRLIDFLSRHPSQ
jgi:hypothetical protein